MLIAGTPTWTFLSARDWAKRTDDETNKLTINISSKKRLEIT
jgi:hypothetical protein